MKNNLGNKETMAKNIKYYLDRYGKSRKDICVDLGFSYTTFCDWVNAKKYPRIDKIEMMANYFGISKADLVEEHSDLPPNAYPAELCRLPVIGKVSAGNGVLAEDNIIGYELADARYGNGEYFLFKVVGDSMSPKIEEGDLVLVHQQDSVDSGNFAVVVVNGEDGFVKKVKYDKEWIELHSINPYYPTRRFEGRDVLQVRVIGKVIELVRKL